MKGRRDKPNLIPSAMPVPKPLITHIKYNQHKFDIHIYTLLELADLSHLLLKESAHINRLMHYY